MTNTISFDESGNTGQDLLNKDQGAFILSSSNFNDNEIEILSNIFDTDDEIHFKKLKKNTKGRKQIIEFINHPLISEKNIISSISHKEFVVYGQIIDKLLEPTLYHKNIDIYKGGKNIIFTNILFFSGQVKHQILYREMLENFISMVRLKTKKSIEGFYLAVKNIYEKIDVNENFLLLLILESKKHIFDISDSFDKYTIDVTLSSFLVLCDLWHEKINLKISVLFDNSKQIEYYQEYIDFMKNSSTQKTKYGYGNRKMTFPSQINDVQLVDSKTRKSIQITDLIASSLGFMFNNQNEKMNDFVKEIQGSKLRHLSNYHTIWFSTEISPKELGMEDTDGDNPLDFLANKMIDKKDNL